MLNAETIGLRLDEQLAQQLSRFAAATRRSKSDIARDAMREYLMRRDGVDDLRRAVLRIAAAASEAELASVDADHDDLMWGEPDASRCAVA